MKFVLLLALTALIVHAQQPCTRLLPEIQDDPGMNSNRLSWYYSRKQDLLNLTLTLGARFGWVGIGFHTTSGFPSYTSGRAMIGANIFTGTLFTGPNGQFDCVTAWRGEVDASGIQTLNRVVPEPNVLSSSVSRVNNELLVMNLVVKPSSITSFQEVGGKLLIAYQYQASRISGTCPAANLAAIRGTHATRDSTATKPPRLVFHGHYWATWDGVSSCDGSTPEPTTPSPVTPAPLTGLCASNPRPSDAAPPPACGASPDFLEVRKSVYLCDVQACQCLGGSYNNQTERCSVTPVCATMRCLAEKRVCYQNAARPYLSSAACGSYLTDYVGKQTCLNNVCPVIGCTDAQYTAVCQSVGGSQPVSTPAASPQAANSQPSSAVGVKLSSLALLGVLVALLGLIF